MINRIIILSEFFFSGSTGQLIYDLALEISKVKETIVLTNNKDFYDTQLGNNKNLKIVKRGLIADNNLKNVSYKSIKGLIFLFECIRWIFFNY